MCRLNHLLNRLNNKNQKEFLFTSLNEYYEDICALEEDLYGEYNINIDLCKDLEYFRKYKKYNDRYWQIDLLQDLKRYIKSKIEKHYKLLTT